MKIVYTGLESSGKSLLMSRTAEKVLRRNARWHKILKKKKKPYPRTMAFNQPMSVDFIAKIHNSGLKYLEWEQFHEIEKLDNTDIFIDELLKIFPQRGSDPLLAHEMDFLTQGAKNGNHIYATSQDFSQVHKQFRLLTNKVTIVKKLFGSKRPMKSMPPSSSVWGMCLRFPVKPESFKGENATMIHKFFPIPFLIRKKDTQRYNTLFKVPRAEHPDKKVRKQRIYAEDQDGNIIYEKQIFK